MIFNLQNCLILSLMLVLVGSYGVLARKNLLLVFLSIEIMLNGVHISLVAFNYFLWPTGETGHFLFMLSIAVAAVEASIGLSMLIVMFKNTGSINSRTLTALSDPEAEE